MTQDFLMQFFAFDHLPPHLQNVSRPFSLLAAEIEKLPANPERTVALRKLIESKDCAVRAFIAGSARRKLPTPVTVNGKLLITPKAIATYDELAELVGYNPAHTPTITVHDLSGKLMSRSLARGEAVELHDHIAVQVSMTTT